MKPGLAHNRDFLAGLLFTAIAVAAVAIARDYPLGFTSRMGPGYFPRALGGVLGLFGFYLMYRGLRYRARIKGDWGWRPLGLITLAIVLFGFSMERIGLWPALILMFLVAAAAGREFRVKEVAVLAALMSTFAAALFVYGLQLPYPLFGGW
jgi:hypothetical protein